MIFLLLLSVVLLVAILGVLGYIIQLIRAPDGTVDPSGMVSEIMHSLGLASDLAAGVAKDLTINIAEARQQFSRLVVLLDRLQTDATATTQSGVRIEAESAHVAEDLAQLQLHARSIEARPETQVGEAADFAAGGNARPLPKTAPRKRKT